MSNKKQTAVEWLREQFHKVPYSQFGNLFEQAKEMEKEQIKNAMSTQVEKYTVSYINEDAQPTLSYDIEDSFNDYYTQTYGE